MLVDCRTIGAPFYAPRYWTELWEGGNRLVTFGGFTAILRPLVDIDQAGDVRGHCEPTRVLIKAVGDIRVIGARHGWWTDHWAWNLDGWRGYALDGPPPSYVVEAIANAYPLPTTITEAHDEYAYWAWRAYGIVMVMPYDKKATALDALGAPELDLVCQVRAEIIRRLLVPGLVASSLAEVALKQRMYVFIEGRDHLLEASILRDLSHVERVSVRPGLVHVQQPVITREVVKVPLVVTTPVEPVHRPAKVEMRPRTPGVQNSAVTEHLLLRPRPSDRAIARKVGVSQTTVGTERKRLIEAGRIDPDAPAVVERRNVRGSYQMKARRGAAKATPGGEARERASSAGAVTTKLSPPSPLAISAAREQHIASSAPISDGRSPRSVRGKQLEFPWAT